MRTTIVLDDDILLRAREHASRRGISLSVVVEEALREKLDRVREGHVVLPTFRRDGLLPGLSLDSIEGIHDRMDQGDRILS